MQNEVTTYYQKYKVSEDARVDMFKITKGKKKLVCNFFFKEKPFV